MKFLILNGPNLNLMRWSEPGVPGELDYNAIMETAYLLRSPANAARLREALHAADAGKTVQHDLED